MLGKCLGFGAGRNSKRSPEILRYLSASHKAHLKQVICQLLKDFGPHFLSSSRYDLVVLLRKSMTPVEG